MTPERWQAVKATLATALEFGPDAREAYLSSLKAADPPLHAEVLSLLLADAAHASALNDSRLGLGDDAIESTGETYVGRRFGAYRLTGLLGEGGMGAVYRARRDDGAYELEVAVKLVRSGVSREFFLRRFRNERQILAQLDHPNIARLIDGGADDDGAPYLVMELVDGIPIDAYCRSRQMTVRERLQLFRGVCAAVHAAHQSLVVHRDLKPSNILVTPAGEPKLLDFGIATITAAEGETAPGRTVMPIMTPAFASPEQVRGERITTASDVYSLGVILYLLLVGRLPYADPRGSAHNLAKEVCEVEPLRPSAALRPTEVAAGSTDTATVSDWRRARRELRGDLDAIVLKALRKAPGERYASAERLAADIERYVDGLPTVARRGSTSYYVGKFVLRNRALVVATVAVAAALVAATVVSVRSAQVARAQQALAERRFQDVRELAGTIVFDVHDAIRDLPGSTPARRLLVERALKYLDSLSHDAADDYGLLAEVASAYERIGDAQGQFQQNSLGDTQQSLASYRHACALRERIVAAHPDDPGALLALARAQRLIANQVWANGDLKAALAGVNRAIETIERLPQEVPVLKEEAAAYQMRSSLYGNPDMGSLASPSDARASAAAEERVVAELGRRLPGDRAIMDLHIVSLLSFGEALEATGEWGEARSRYELALQITRSGEPAGPSALQLRHISSIENHLAFVDARLDDPVAALAAARAAIEVGTRMLAADPRNHLYQRSLAISRANAAAMMAVAGDHRGALENVDSSIELMHGILREDPGNDRYRIELGSIQEGRGDINMVGGAYNYAIADYTSAAQIMDRAGAADPADLATLELRGEARNRLGLALTAASRLDEAAIVFGETLRLLVPAERPLTLDNDGLINVADAHAGIGNLEAAGARASHGAAAQLAHLIAAAAGYRAAIGVWQQIPIALHHRVSEGLKVDDQPSLEDKLRRNEVAIARLRRQSVPH